MLFRTGSATSVCNLLEELLWWYLPTLQHQDVMLSHRVLLVQSVSPWPGDLVVLLEEGVITFSSCFIKRGCIELRFLWKIMYDLKKIKVVLGFKSQGSLAVGPEQPAQQVGWFVCLFFKYWVREQSF